MSETREHGPVADAKMIIDKAEDAIAQIAIAARTKLAEMGGASDIPWPDPDDTFCKVAQCDCPAYTAPPAPTHPHAPNPPSICRTRIDGRVCGHQFTRHNVF
ncbi:hypothetical protein Acor_01060 [Acrocarpospora corrugata]|uniref:Uncharacterized protein n=1 Tax=Acrocarpospora corrugata TaxID=35763 RepID=A0A5M3VMN7_9ACTN|nr:hypothetical protein [Acrocarpospora corrugata]GER98044.1 hypothetical protein Acor_01060 [Acrocarpospora corrugata]